MIPDGFNTDIQAWLIDEFSRELVFLCLVVLLSYRIVVTDKAKARDGRFVELLGHYDPRTEPATIKVDQDKARVWLSKGATPSDTVRSLFKKVGVFEGATETSPIVSATVKSETPDPTQTDASATSPADTPDQKSPDASATSPVDTPDQKSPDASAES